MVDNRGSMPIRLFTFFHYHCYLGTDPYNLWSSCIGGVVRFVSFWSTRWRMTSTPKGSRFVYARREENLVSVTHSSSTSRWNNPGSGGRHGASTPALWILLVAPQGTYHPQSFEGQCNPQF